MDWVDQAHLEFQVRWTLGDVTWEPLAECKELEALDEYLELHGVLRYSSSGWLNISTLMGR